MKQTPEDVNLTEEEFIEIVNEGGDRLEELARKMQKFNSNIVGSNAYFYKRRNELESLME